ncbi:MAG TPA: FAD-dependent oxidoreductase [Acidobacteriaceae bacterium]|jgi:FADH2 O2-dependent halogenase|nr:FAD-dependent oxidoreductase [Acidobacteriaceae bacterium]
MYDVAVVGSGFAGSLFAMIAHRLGRSVVLVERGRHPRVVIGESSTPLTNLLLEDLTTRYDLPALRPLAKWGSWQKAHPEVACGLKRGFTFYHHDLERPRTTRPERSEQLLVAASPQDAIADTHWYRADFDALLVREAQAMGVVYLDATEIHSVTESVGGVELDGTRDGVAVHLSAKFVVDATGPRGLLHRTLRLQEAELPDFPGTQALYSHFSGVRRLEDAALRDGEEQPPYPVDAAAVHHVFDGGWIWVLQFNNGVTSAGVVTTDARAAEWKIGDGSEAWGRMLRRIPVLQEQFAEAKAERGFVHLPRVTFRSATIAGKRWALLPSAAGFVDPLLSTGFPLTLLGAARLAAIVEQDWESPRFEKRLQTYAAETEAELLATARLIASLYANMGNFPVFAALSLLYFAAVSYAETARRLGKPELASSFLLHAHPVFGPACVRLFERARRVRTEEESAALVEEILQAIAPFNVAGLGDARRRNWYPVDAEDLLTGASKLEASRDDVLQMLQRCGFPM